jgi:hypothetical protein
MSWLIRYLHGGCPPRRPENGLVAAKILRAQTGRRIVVHERKTI